MKKIVKICLLISIILMVWQCMCFASTGSVTTDGVRVRKEASKEAEVITVLNESARVEITENLGEWYKVKYQDYEGYMFAEYVKSDEDKAVENDGTSKEEETVENQVEETEEVKPEVEENTQVIEEVVYPREVKTVSNFNVYIIPSITASITGNIEKEKTITIKEKLNDWSYVQLDNTIGWVRNYFLENAEVTTESENKEEEIQEKTDLAFTTGYINVDSANVREEPNTEAKIVTTLILNNQVTLISETEEWYKIEYKEYKGYIAKRLISEKITETTSRSQSEARQTDTETTNEETQKTAYIKVGVANVREQATTSSKILTTLKQKAEIKIIGEEEEFYKISANDKTGYIAKYLVVDTLEEIAKVMESQNTASVVVSNNGTCDGQKIVDFAKQYLGYSYVYGGTTPANGFDCSGFVYYVFNSCGYKLSRSCPVQAQSGVAVDKANLQLADIVFFNNTSTDGSISHVGIYIGDGRFIHASNPTRGVVTDTLATGYYSNYIHSARRVL